MILFFAVGAAAETTNIWSDAEIQGRQLAQQLCAASPAENFTNTGMLKIRDKNNNRTETPVRFRVFATKSGWGNDYAVVATNKQDNVEGGYFEIIHTGGQPDYYFKHPPFQHIEFGGTLKSNSPTSRADRVLSGDEIMAPFANSDFWLCDLGLEFFHWPQHKVLPKTTPLRRGRSYTLLESTNPNPTTNGYSRVLSWIDKESGGILEAEAYDTRGKLLKVFAPKSFTKVNGQWELQEMEIRNVQTGSRTRLVFDLKKP